MDLAGESGPDEADRCDEFLPKEDGGDNGLDGADGVLSTLDDCELNDWDPPTLYGSISLDFCELSEVDDRLPLNETVSFASTLSSAVRLLLPTDVLLLPDFLGGGGPGGGGGGAGLLLIFDSLNDLGCLDATAVGLGKSNLGPLRLLLGSVGLTTALTRSFGEIAAR